MSGSVSDDELDELLAEAELGEQARAFIDSDLGRCMLGMAEQEARAAKDELGLVDPDDAKKIRTLQNAIWRAKQFDEWLKELVTNGDGALERYRDGSRNN